MGNEYKIGFCGDVCSECPRYIATMANDISELEKIAELWYRLGFRDQILPPDQLKCLGCERNKPCSHGITSCEHLNGIGNCGECPVFPCLKIDTVFQKTDHGFSICKDRCSESEFDRLFKSFYMKEEILTEIHKTHFNY
jgi:hypothetical protein